MISSTVLGLRLGLSLPLTPSTIAQLLESVYKWKTDGWEEEGEQCAHACVWEKCLFFLLPLNLWVSSALAMLMARLFLFCTNGRLELTWH